MLHTDYGSIKISGWHQPQLSKVEEQSVIGVISDWNLARARVVGKLGVCILKCSSDPAVIKSLSYTSLLRLCYASPRLHYPRVSVRLMKTRDNVLRKHKLHSIHRMVLKLPSAAISVPLPRTWLVRDVRVRSLDDHNRFESKQTSVNSQSD